MKRIFKILILGLACLVAIVFFGIMAIYRDRRPAIYFAAKNGDTNAVARYLASGSNVNANINSYPWSDTYRAAPLLCIAVENGQIPEIDFLLKSGADPNKPDSWGATPLLYAIGLSRNEITAETRAQMLQALLNAGASPNKAAKEGHYRQESPLMMAAEVNDTNSALTLLKRGADINATNSNGQTALHLCVSHPEMTRFLLNAGASATRLDIRGETPVNYALRERRTNTLAILTNTNLK